MTTFPPASGLKKEVPKLMSNKSNTKPAAKTGVENKASTDVANNAQQNKGSLSHFMLGTRMLIRVTMKFTDPRIDEVPTKTIARIHMDWAVGAVMVLRGG